MRAPCCFPSVISGGLKCLLQCSQVQKIAKHCENSYRFNSQRSELTVLNVFNYSQLYILCNDSLKNGKKDIVAFLSNPISLQDCPELVQLFYPTVTSVSSSQDEWMFCVG